MPRKASARKTAAQKLADAKAKREAAKTERSAPEGPEIDEIARKNANPEHTAPSEETARVNAASQSAKPNANGEADAKAVEDDGLTKQQRLDKRMEEARELHKTFGPDGHPVGKGVVGEEPDYSEATIKASSNTKITREEGEPPKPYDGPVVQPGGGGMPLKAETGEPIR